MKVTILRITGVAIGLLAILAVVLLLRGLTADVRERENDTVAAEDGADVTWTCSMHPQIRQPRPGQCPICHMDLIPVEDDDDDPGEPRRISISEAARRLAEIEVVPVERRFVAVEIRMPGKIGYDETRIRRISARVGGRLDRLYADYTGIRVDEGVRLAEIYSPELFSVQQELLQAGRSLDQARETGREPLVQAAERTLESARERLRLWGFTREQVAHIEETGHPVDRLEIVSPISGTVTEKHVNEGDYVNVGSRMFTVADFSRVWVNLEAYETDLAWIAFGQEVSFETGAFPGEQFKGRIVYIEPYLQERTRTVRVRLNADNPGGRLRPGMFVRALLKSELDADGNVLAPDYAGKWISAYHPEIVSDQPGECEICGSTLVSAQELGLIREGEPVPPLIIPVSAPLVTGKRAVVYVQIPGAERPTFEGRDVVLGPRAGDHYIVRSGLEEGELVVRRGAFKIDSELQIRGRPSMMSPEEEEELRPAFEITDEFGQHIDETLAAYFDLSTKLAEDDFDGAREAAVELARKIEEVDADTLDEPARIAWEAEAEMLLESTRAMAAAADISAMRERLVGLTDAMKTVVSRFGTGGGVSVYVAHCPMAFDNRGADWLQAHEDIFNPYYGAGMLKCGEITDQLFVAPHQQ